MFFKPKSVPLFKLERHVPKRLGQFSLEQIEVYPDRTSGTKYSYKSGQIVMTAFVYNQLEQAIPDGWDNELHMQEFESSFYGMVNLSPDLGWKDLICILEPATLMHVNDNKLDSYLGAAISFNDHRRTPLFEGFSFILLRGDAGHYNKLRCTFPKDIEDEALEALADFGLLWSRALRATLN